MMLLTHRMSAATPLSVMCHSMGNFVLKKFAPDDASAVRLEFEHIFMVAADVRATTFNVQEKDGPDVDGPDILSICKKKVHVLWYWWDRALLARRVENEGRIALGKVGKQYSEGKLIDNGAKLCWKNSNQC